MKTVSFYTKEEIRFINKVLLAFIENHAFGNNIGGAKAGDLIEFYEKLDTKGGSFMNIDEISLFMKNQVNAQLTRVQNRKDELLKAEKTLKEYQQTKQGVDSAKNTMQLFNNILKDYE